MERRVSNRVKELSRSLSLSNIIVALAVGVILPVILSTSLGIVTLVLGESSRSIVLGVLIISFAAAAIGGAIVVTVLLGRRAKIARLQADLVANVSHELRTPLTAIRMYSQTLQMGRLANDPDRTAECVETILRETEWLETTIDGILTWRGSAQEPGELKIKSAQLGDAVRDAVERFTRMVAPGEVELKIDINSERVVPHDRQVVAMALLNLLVNAYKYTHSEKRIRVAVDEVDDEWIEIGVEDNGIGISLKEQRKIFQPFYRVDSRLRGKAAGAGLGLAIVRHQAKAHKGEVYVESEPGQGSRFALRLPIA